MRDRAATLLRGLGFRLGTIHRDAGLVDERRNSVFQNDQVFVTAYSAGVLDDLSRAELQIMLSCSQSLQTEELREILTAAGLISDRGRLTDLGRDVATVLLELT